MLMLMQLYISFVRRRRKCNNYRNWDKYDWQDYVCRAKLAKTFYAHHVPQKATFGDLLPDPEEWSEPVAEPAKPTASPSTSATMASINNAAAAIMDDWDSDALEFVSSASKE